MSRGVAVPAAILLALLTAWWTWATATGAIGYRTVATRADGSPVVLSLLRVDSVSGPDRYRVASGATLIDVDGPTAGLVEGHEVTVGGTVVDGRVVQTWRAAAPDRGAKRWLGILGIVVCTILVGTQVRWTSEGLALRG